MKFLKSQVESTRFGSSRLNEMTGLCGSTRNSHSIDSFPILNIGRSIQQSFKLIQLQNNAIGLIECTGQKLKPHARLSQPISLPAC